MLYGFANIHYEYSVETPSNCYCRIVSKRDSQTAMIARGDNVPVWQQGILPNPEKRVALAFQPKYFGGITFVSILICLGVWIFGEKMSISFRGLNVKFLQLWSSLKPLFGSIPGLRSSTEQSLSQCIEGYRFERRHVAVVRGWVSPLELRWCSQKGIRAHHVWLREWMEGN